MPAGVGQRAGRDPFDLWDASRRGEVNPARVVEVFQAYLRANNLRVTRAEFERNLAAKARNRLFIEEVKATPGKALGSPTIRSKLVAPLPRQSETSPEFPAADSLCS